MVDIQRKKRIDESIRHELANILLRHPEQPLFKQITITAVDVSADLAVAKVFFSVFTDEKVKEATKVLQKAAWVLRKSLARSLNLRLTPRLNFIYDESIQRGQKIAELIDAAIAADEQQKENY
jgi:ribosome-binding factor A